MNKIYDGIIFDVDGVLIDVKDSFLKVIKITSKYVLKNWYGKNILVTNADVKSIKDVKGFNNDWDATYTLVELLDKGVSRVNFLSEAKIVSKRVQQTKKYKDILSIFDTYYWGSDLFTKRYKVPPLFINKEGFFKKEKQIIKQSILKALSKNYVLGIATGRNKFEVDFGLSAFKDINAFIPRQNIITEEDVSYTKPHPAPLLKAKAKMKVKTPIYIGDSINDVLAAKAAKMPSIYIGKEKLGDYQLKNVNELGKVILI